MSLAICKTILFILRLWMLAATPTAQHDCGQLELASHHCRDVREGSGPLRLKITGPVVTATYTPPNLGQFQLIPQTKGLEKLPLGPMNLPDRIPSNVDCSLSLGSRLLLLLWFCCRSLLSARGNRKCRFLGFTRLEGREISVWWGCGFCWSCRE